MWKRKNKLTKYLKESFSLLSSFLLYFISFLSFFSPLRDSNDLSSDPFNPMRRSGNPLNPPSCFSSAFVPIAVVLCRYSRIVESVRHCKSAGVIIARANATKKKQEREQRTRRGISWWTLFGEVLSLSHTQNIFSFHQNSIWSYLHHWDRENRDTGKWESCGANTLQKISQTIWYH